MFCGAIYFAFGSEFLGGMFCISFLIMYFLKEKFFGLVMSVLTVVVFLLKVLYIRSLTIDAMSDKTSLTLCVIAIVGVIFIAVCTKLENINYYKINAIKKSL